MLPQSFRCRSVRRCGVSDVHRGVIPILLVILVIAFFAPVVLLGRVFYLKDAQLVVYPTRMLLRERLLSLDLPEWLPQLDMGMPFLANPSNGVLYPLNALLLLPSPWCVGVFVVFHSVVAIVGAWFLLRFLRLGSLASSVGAVAFALGGYMVSLTSISNYMMSLAWLPCVTWLVLRSQRSGRFGDAACAGLLWSLQILSGEPQGVLLTGWFVVASIIGTRTRSIGWSRTLGLLAVTVLIAALVALPQIVPALELIPRSRRASGIGLVEASHWSLHPLRLLELLVPSLFGNPTNFEEYLGFFMNDEDSPMHRDPWMVSPYVGSTALMFALGGLASPQNRHKRWVWGLGLLLLLSLLLALGRHLPFFAVYFQHVPAARLFRYPAKIFGLSAAILPVLAAVGFEAWCRKPSSRVFRRIASVMLLLMLAAFVFSSRIGAWLQSMRPAVAAAAATSTVRHALLAEVAWFGGGVLLLFLANRKRLRLCAMGMVLLSVTQIIRANQDAYRSASPGVYSEPALAKTIRSRTPNGEPTRLIHSAAALELEGIDRASGDVYAQALTNSLMKDLGIAYGIGYADSYLSSEEGVKFEFWRRLGRHRRSMLDLFSVRHLVLPLDLTVANGIGLRRLREVGSIGVAVYENETALPFAYGVSKVATTVDQDEALRLMTDPHVVKGEVAVVDGSLVTGMPPGPSERIGRCRLVAPLDDGIELDCELSKDGVVVVNASHHPNFRAQVDGVSVPIWRANGFVMATRVPAGRHALAFDYVEDSLVLTGFASLCACLLGLLLVLRDRRPTVSY